MAWHVAFSPPTDALVMELPVHFGIALSGRGPLATPEIMLRIAERADALRFSSVFVTDHVVIPPATDSVYPYSATGKVGADWSQGYLEPLAVLGWLARATRHVRLGTSVLVVPYRNPVVTAKMLATLDVLSGGRVILGAGVGWMREEFEALRTAPYQERGRVTDEYLRLMRECWTREPVDFRGTYYDLAPVSALPKPRQRGGIPIWIGGHTEAALRRTGELGDAWHPIGLRPPAGLHPEEYREKADRVRQWAAKAGRNPESIALTFRAPLDVASSRAKGPPGDRALLRGTAEQVAADIRRYQAVGVSHLVFDPAAADLKGYLTIMERFAEDVRPRLGRGGAASKPPRRRSKVAARPAGARSRRKPARQ
jgi:probable F420-dependent oxidoreductase